MCFPPSVVGEQIDRRLFQIIENHGYKTHGIDKCKESEKKEKERQ